MKYFMMQNGQRIGPMTPPELVRAGMSRSTLVWRDGMPNWCPADQMSEFAHLEGGIPPDAGSVQSSRGFSRQYPSTEGEVVSAIGGAVVRTVRPFPIGAHLLNLICAGALVAILHAVDPRWVLAWPLLVPCPLLGLIGVAFGRRSIDFWWGYWLGVVGWIVSWVKRRNRSSTGRGQTSPPATDLRVSAFREPDHFGSD